MFALAACTAPTPGPPPPHSGENAAVPGPDWPAAELLRRAVELAADPATIRDDVAEDRARMETLRAGLHHPDPTVAARCAARLPWDVLDHRESGRCVELLTPLLTDPPPGFHFDEFRSYLGSEELDPVFEVLARAKRPPPPYEKITVAISELHRQSRAVNLPTLCRLVADPATSWDARRGLFDCIQTILPNTDRFRREVAEAVLAVRPGSVETSDGNSFGISGPGSADRKGIDQDSSIPTGPGYPDPLRRVLVMEFSSGFAIEPVLGWSLRWAAEEKPGTADIDWIVGVDAGSGFGVASSEVFLRALGAGSDDASLHILMERAARGDLEAAVRGAALASLVRRGRGEYLPLLEDLSKEDPAALAHLAEVDPDRVGALLRGRLLVPWTAPAITDAGEDDEEAWIAWEDIETGGFEFLREALIQGDRWGGFPSETVFAGFEDSALAAGLDGLTLTRVGSTVPTCGTRRLARAAVEALGRHPPAVPPAWHNAPRRGLPLQDDGLAFLELGDPDGLRALAGRWLDTEVPAGDLRRSWALDVLLILGAPEHERRIFEEVGRRGLWRSGDGNPEFPLILREYSRSHDCVPAYLARSGGDFLRRRFRESALRRGRPERGAMSPEEALVGLAVMDGLPESMGSPLLGALDSPGESAAPPADPTEPAEGFPPAPSAGEPAVPFTGYPREELARLILAGRPMEAMELVVSEMKEPSGFLQGADAGLLRRFERVSADRPGSSVAERVFQRALLGDADAMAETEAAMRCGRYRWAEHIDVELFLALDLRRMDIALDNLDASCCRFCEAANPMEWLFDRGQTDWQDAGIATGPVHRRWWKEVGPRIRWSRLAGRFVPEPVE